MSNSKTTIYLADLTHTGSGIASNVMPLGIGLLAAHLLKYASDEINIELFKYPDDLDRALSRQSPQVIGFANYSWNLNLSYKFTTRIKEVAPNSVVVFGGPNYGLTESEVETFWRRYPEIDFYIVGEGEIAFLQLYQKLEQSDYNVSAVKNSISPPQNCHYVKDNRIVKGNMLERIETLDGVGSPYLSGIMDKFFDNILIPIIHTTRGCPFTCAYCSEGSRYYSKVARRKDIINLNEELDFIAQRKWKTENLVMTDANFGMYKEDREKAEIIAKIQDKFNWPKHILVSTGKNNKERVIEISDILKGSLSITASIQSSDHAVLQNINRTNISLEAMDTIVKNSSSVDATTYCEIILGLPGDSVVTHTDSLREVITSGINIIRMYQLILLPQTELNTPEFRSRYGIQTKFRINPRSFGNYDVLGEKLISVEAEEICVASNVLTFEDYLQCRELDLTIEIIHNSGAFEELYGLSRWLKVSWFDFVFDFHDNRRSYVGSVTELYDIFNADNRKGLWDSIDEVEKNMSSHIDEYLNDKQGTNEISKSKAWALSYLLSKIHDILYEKMELLLAANGYTEDIFKTYLKELKEFSLLRKKEFTNTASSYNVGLHFDFKAIHDHNFVADPREYFRVNSIEYYLFHSDDQLRIINTYIRQYGKTIDGIGRILMRAPAKSLFRKYSLMKKELITCRQ